MTTSQYGGFIPIDTTNRLVATEPIDTGLVNDGLLNGAEHLADEQPQTIVDWISPASSQFVTWSIAPSTGRPRVFCRAYDAPNLHPRPNGKPPVFVVECMGAINGNPGTVSIYVGLFGPRDGATGTTAPYGPSAGINAILFQFSSTTPAWATPQTVVYDARHSVD